MNKGEQMKNQLIVKRFSGRIFSPGVLRSWGFGDRNDSLAF